MNCANHPDRPATAYCQFCGKPLCGDCARTIHNIVGCEDCIAVRLGATPAAGNYTVPFGDGQNFQYAASGSIPPQPSPGAANPWLAFALGWIPGVGAMYNGQFVKGLVHVLVFAVLVALSDTYGLFGVIIAGWVFYQVFDAYQTAIARRDGLPLPNPLGLNDIGQWFTGQHGDAFSAQTGATPVPPANPVPPPSATPFMVPPSPPSAGFTAPTPSMPPVPPGQYDLPEVRSGVPTGAVVLIGLGILFLLGNLGILNHYWLDRSWPLVLIAIGVWLLVRRSQSPPGGTHGGTSGTIGGPQ
jgi:TM2 domain-containing membrane protein YozV